MSRIRELSVQKAEPDMPAVVEARSMLCAVPIDLSRGESKGVWLQRVSRLLGLSPAKAKRIYYHEVKRIDADTFNHMRIQLNQLQERAEQRRETLDGLNARLETARSRQGSGTSEGDSRRAAPARGRSDGKIPGRAGEDRA